MSQEKMTRLIPNNDDNTTNGAMLPPAATRDPTEEDEKPEWTERTRWVGWRDT